VAHVAREVYFAAWPGNLTWPSRHAHKVAVPDAQTWQNSPPDSGTTERS
jgi:hypothetical protein